MSCHRHETMSYRLHQATTPSDKSDMVILINNLAGCACAKVVVKVSVSTAASRRLWLGLGFVLGCSEWERKHGQVRDPSLTGCPAPLLDISAIGSQSK